MIDRKKKKTVPYPDSKSNQNYEALVISTATFLTLSSFFIVVEFGIYFNGPPILFTIMLLIPSIPAFLLWYHHEAAVDWLYERAWKKAFVKNYQDTINIKALEALTLHLYKDEEYWHHRPCTERSFITIAAHLTDFMKEDEASDSKCYIMQSDRIIMHKYHHFAYGDRPLAPNTWRPVTKYSQA